MMLNNTTHTCSQCAVCNYVFPSSCIEFNAMMTTDDPRITQNMVYGDHDGTLEPEYAGELKTKEDYNNELRLKYWRKWEVGISMAADRLLEAKKKEERFIGKPTSASYAYSEKEGAYVLMLMDDNGKWLTDANRVEWIDFSKLREQVCADYLETFEWTKDWVYKTFIAQARKEVENIVSFKLEMEEKRKKYQANYMDNLMQYVESQEMQNYDDISIVAEIPVESKDKVKA